ncbi:MAG: sugar MFS transporter [Thermoleophilia bacterium]
MPPGLPRRVVVAGFVLLFSMGLLISSFGPLLPDIRDEFGVGTVATGVLVASIPTGATIGILACAALDARVPARALLRASGVLLAVGMAGLALAPSWPGLLAGGLVAGLGYGGAVVLGNGIVVGAYGESASVLLNLQNAAFGVGAVLGPLCVAALPEDDGRIAWLAYSAVALAAAVLYAGLAGDASTGARAGADAEAAARWSGRLAGFCLLFACYIGVEVSTGAWATTHLKAVGAGDAAADLTTSLFFLGLAAGRTIAAPIAPRAGLGRTLVVASIVATGLLALTAATPLGGWSYLLVGAALGPIFPTGLAWVASDQARARHAMAAVLVTGNAGGMVLPPLVGAVVAAVGDDRAPLPIAVACALCAGLAVILLTSARGAGRMAPPGPAP